MSSAKMTTSQSTTTTINNNSSSQPIYLWSQLLPSLHGAQDASFYVLEEPPKANKVAFKPSAVTESATPANYHWSQILSSDFEEDEISEAEEMSARSTATNEEDAAETNPACYSWSQMLPSVYGNATSDAEYDEIEEPEKIEKVAFNPSAHPVVSTNANAAWSELVSKYEYETEESYEGLVL